MPSFKPKSGKKIKFNKKSTITLDTKHKEFLNEFSKDETSITECKYEIQNLKKQLEDENVKLEDRLDISDKISALKDHIKDVKLKKKIIFLIILSIFLNILKIKKTFRRAQMLKPLLLKQNW